MGYLILRRAALLVATAGFAFAVQAAQPLPIDPDGVLNRPARVAIHQPMEADPGERLEAAARLGRQSMSEQQKAAMIAALQRKQALYPNQTLGAAYPAGMPVWHSIGPRTSKYSYNGVFIDGVDSGRIRNILVDPTNPNRVYVLTSGGGLWKTGNFYAARPDWSATTDAVLSTSGGAAALGRNANTIYLGVGDPFDVMPTLAGVMLKSTDGGQTWGPWVNLPGATSVRDVKVDTSGAADIVLVATDVGVFRSTDGGASYALSDVGQADGLVSAWSIARTSAGWLVSMVDPGFDFGIPATGQLYRSRDHGASWNAIDAAGDPYTSVGRATLAVARPGESVVYSIASDPTGASQGDVYRSKDGGRSWSALNVTGQTPSNPNCFQPDMNILGGQAWYNQMIVVSPADAKRNTLYIGGNLSTARSADGGASWTLTSSWLPTGCDYVTPALPYVHADNHTATIASYGGKEQLLFGTDGGVFLSADGGASFDSSKNVGIVALLAQTIMSTPQRDSSAITGLQDTGTRARVGESHTWNQVFGGDGEGVAWSQANNAVTLVTAEFMTIARQPGLPSNTGDPNNWLDGSAGIDFTNPDCFPFFTPLTTPTAQLDPTGQVFYTSTGSRLYRTTDGAQSWQQVVQFGSTAAPACIIRQTWHATGLHPKNPQLIALAGAGGRALISQDGGSSWSLTQLTAAVPGYNAFNSSAAWAGKSTLYYSSESTASGVVRVVKTTDFGATWSAADNGLPDAAVHELAADRRDRSGNTLYAATDIGLYWTQDGGANWALYGAGLPNVAVEGVYVSPEGEFLRIATYGRGVWEVDLEH
ncbi:MAG: hypothetical protein KGJ52_01995 [Gammaproteobacteria bacterium]|nr:hypothetical protein [Gammaproteobacteria bacterium]